MRRKLRALAVCILMISALLLVNIHATDADTLPPQLEALLSEDTEGVSLAPNTADTTVVAAVVLAISATAAIIICKKH